MNTLIITAAVIALVFAMIITLISLVAMAAWRVVYYAFRCRKAPIQKTVITTAMCIWVISGAIIALLP